MGNIPYIDILILAMIAVFILNRLRNVLGKKTGNEEDIIKKFKLKKDGFKESTPDMESNLKKEGLKKDETINLHKDKNINKVLNEIKKIESSFGVNEFIDNSKKAFEYILGSYSKNNLKALEPLLEKKIFQIYKKEIDNRLKKKEIFEITIIGIKDPKIVSAKVVNNIAEIIVEYNSEQVQVLKDANNKIIEGDTNQILNIEENWTFSRKLKSKSPNWSLIKISEKS